MINDPDVDASCHVRRKIDWIDITNTKGLQKDISCGVLVKMNKIRIENHTPVVVKKKLLIGGYD